MFPTNYIITKPNTGGGGTTINVVEKKVTVSTHNRPSVRTSIKNRPTVRVRK